jgi:serine/threonine protein kinase
VAEALDLPVDARSACLARSCPDPRQRAEAAQLLRACEEAAASAIFDSPALRFAAPVLAEVEDQAGAVAGNADQVLIGRFKLVRLVGRGGMGAVYEAWDSLLQCTVAVKLLETVSPDSFTGVDQLRRELLIARRVTHPNVARVFDCYEGESGLFMTMEFLKGETLAERRARNPALSLAEGLGVLRDVCAAVDAIHAQGIIHRDLKPSNIFLTPGNGTARVVVTDFGVAHVAPGPRNEEAWGRTRTGILVGTPRYMAPEQLRGEQVTPAADVFALAVVASELLGAAPELLAKEQSASSLKRSLQGALAENPSERPASPRELFALLERTLQRPLWRRRWFVLAVIAAAAFLFAMSLLQARGPGSTSASRPSLATAKGQRLFAQGLERLKKLDSVGARDLLEGAVAAEPESAVAREALARAWWSLGYASKARVLAREAWQATDASRTEARARAEGLYRKMNGDIPSAEARFEQAFATSRSLDDALDLASVQPARKALDTLNAARGSSGQLIDPRLDLALADAAVRAGRFADATEAARRVEARARSEQWALLLAAALRAGAKATFETDQPIEPAFAALDEAASIMREAGDLGAVADVECEKALVLAMRGTEHQFAESRSHLEKAISLFRRQGNTERAHWWLATIALQVLGHGGIAEADSLFKAAREELESSGEQPEASFWAGAGWAAMYAGDLGRANAFLARFHAATDASEVMPRPFGIEFEAELLREEDRLSEAKTLLELWLSKGEANGIRRILTDVPVRLARLESDLGDPDRCLERLRRLEQGGHDLGPLFARFQSPIEGTCLLRKGEVSEARRLGERGWAAASTSGFFTWRILNGLVLVRADAAERHFSEALKRAEDLLREASAFGHVPAIFECRLALGEVQAAAKMPAAPATLTALASAANEKGFARIARLAQEAQRRGHR